MLPCQNGNYMRKKTTNIVKDAGEKKPLYASGINITTSVILKIRIEVNQNPRMDLSCDSVIFKQWNQSQLTIHILHYHVYGGTITNANYR